MQLELVTYGSMRLEIHFSQATIGQWDRACGV